MLQISQNQRYKHTWAVSPQPTETFAAEIELSRVFNDGGDGNSITISMGIWGNLLGYDARPKNVRI